MAEFIMCNIVLVLSKKVNLHPLNEAENENMTDSKNLFSVLHQMHFDLLENGRKDEKNIGKEN